MSASIDGTRLLVVDIEATCWRRRKPPPGQKAEIIEVGVCAYHADSGALTDKRGVLVRPTQSRVSAFCTQLTTLTQKQVEVHGVSFGAACEILRREYGSESVAWASWGDYDRRKFAAQCRDREVPYPFSAQHLNIKARFGALHEMERAPGMQRALEMAGVEPEGTHHRGVDDAWNIGRLLHTMVERFGWDRVFETTL